MRPVTQTAVSNMKAFSVDSIGMDAIRQYKKLLLIEDAASTRKAFREILNNSFGKEVVEVIEADTWEEGLEIYKKLEPEIVFCNIDMPGKSGLDICKEIQAAKAVTSVILMFEHDDQEDRAIPAWEAGADGFMCKPIQKGKLIFAVNHLLRVISLNSVIKSKDERMQKSLEELHQSEINLADLNEEIKEDKKRLQDNLKEMVSLNSLLDSKNNQIVEMNEDLSSRFDSTVGLLVNIIELKQSSHRGHAERVAEISVFIARKMGVPERQVQNIRIAARLHELGIVSLPADEKVEDVTNEGKSRKVTRHPLVGEMLLKGFPGFEDIAEIIRHSHENVNGSGIPDGLKGEGIPIGSRIISAASFYDHTILANPDISPIEALNRAGLEAGTLFDENAIARLSEYVRNQDDSDGEVSSIDCTVFALKEGMELASDIYSESGINLLRKGTVLDKEILDKVLKFHNVDPVAGTIKIKQN